MHPLFVSLLLLTGFSAAAFDRPPDTPTRHVTVHDPVMIRQKDTYYLFCTGMGISVWTSPDRKNWKRAKPVFAKAPEWAVKAIPGFRGHIWAPDITFRNGQYYLYYSVSAFGKNTSCIGLAVNKTLDTASPDFKWVDMGKVIQSVPGRDLWNAIDPNLLEDEKGVPWLSFGSFWNGLKLVKLNSEGTAPAQPEEWHTIAARSRAAGTPDTSAGDGAIEAPFLFRKGGYYYLFASTDYCCRGEKSTYKMVVGRSKDIRGPYLDKVGTPMNRGGGSLLMEGNKEWFGVGHNSVYTFGGTDYLIFHGYDAGDKGRSKLRIETVEWDAEGWPYVSSTR